MITIIKSYPDNNSLADSRAIKKEVERVIKVPRTRMSDVTRLTFGPDGASWEDIDSVPILHPIYPMPPMERGHYDILLSSPFKVTYQGRLTVRGTINDLVRQICKMYQDLWMDPGTQFSEEPGNLNLNDYYLHSIFLRKDGTGWIEFEVAL